MHLSPRPPKAHAISFGANSLKIFVLTMALAQLLACAQGFERYLPKEPVKYGPKILSTTPSHQATNVAPDPANHTPADTATRIRIVFDKTIDTSVTPQFNAYSHNLTGSASSPTILWYSISVTGATYAWSSTNVANDTLTVTLPWVRFPENNRIGFDLTTSTIKDTDGLTLEDKDKKYFTTGFNTGKYAPVKTGQYQCYYYGTDWHEDSTNGCTGQTYSSSDANLPARQNGILDGTGLFTNKRFPISGHPANVSAGDCNGSASDNNCMPYSDDSVTNLRWKTCAQGQAYNDVGSEKCSSVGTEDFTWGEAVNACAALNTQNAGVGYSGRTDWRLPTIEELETLVDYGIKFEQNSITDRPAIHGFRRDNTDMEGPFPNTTVDAAFWSSTGVALTEAGGYSNAWNLEFKNGHVGMGGGASALLNSDRATTNRKRVRCVAGPTVTPTVRVLTDNGNGTISDNVSNLIWKKCKIGYNDDATCTDNAGVANTHKWYNALNQCASLNFAGQTDWRLPNINELKSLNDRTTHLSSGRTIDTSVFTGLSPTTEVFWSSTTKAAAGVPSTTNFSTAWGYSYAGGLTFVNEKGQASNTLAGHSYSVLCVRGP